MMGMVLSDEPKSRNWEGLWLGRSVIEPEQ